MSTAASASLFYPLLHLTPARLHLTQGDKAASASHLAAQYGRAAQEGWRYGQIETRLWQALAAPTTNVAVAFLAGVRITGQSTAELKVKKTRVARCGSPSAPYRASPAR